MKVRCGFAFLFWLFTAIAGFHLGYIGSVVNQTANVINARLEISDYEATLFQSKLGSFGRLAMMFGAPLGARLLPYGRRKVIWLASFVGISGLLL